MIRAATGLTGASDKQPSATAQPQAARPAKPDYLCSLHATRFPPPPQTHLTTSRVLPAVNEKLGDDGRLGDEERLGYGERLEDDEVTERMVRY